MRIARNISKDERITRLGVGFITVSGAVFGLIGLWGLLGLILIVTACINFCPLYRAIGIKTCTDC